MAFSASRAFLVLVITLQCVLIFRTLHWYPSSLDDTFSISQTGSSKKSPLVVESASPQHSNGQSRTHKDSAKPVVRNVRNERVRSKVKPVVRDARVSQATPGMCETSLQHRPWNECKVQHIFNESMTKVKPGTVSIVAACQGRAKTLLHSLPTWLQDPVVASIVIVDWGSREPLSEKVSAFLGRDRRVRVVRLARRADWVLSRAYNLGAMLSAGERVLKVDCDTLLTNDFFKEHPLRAGQFYAGNWEAARDENELHLNGLLYMSRKAYMRIGGYDERITTYGWDDTDIQQRLIGAGLTRSDLNYDLVSHFQHASALRTANQRSVRRLGAKLSTERNRRRAELLTPWGKGETRAQGTLFQVEQLASQDWEAHLLRAAPANFAVLSAAQEQRAKAGAADAFLMDRHGIAWSQLARLTAQQKIDASELYGLSKPLLVLRAMHGLGNRMRAVASAAVIAKATGRQLLLVWPLDHHLSARWEELYDDRLDVVTEFNIQGNPLLRKLFRVYDCMPKGPSVGLRELPLDLSGSKHVYVVSAYRLNHATGNLAAEATWMKQLLPAAPVMSLIHRYQGIHSAVGVHIRKVVKDANVKHGDNEYSSKGWALIRVWRARSQPSVFAAEMARMLRKSPGLRFFVVCDDADVLAHLRMKFGKDKVMVPSHPSCAAAGKAARASRCVQYALAEIYIASKTQTFLGSTWSSFSELIARLGGMPTRWSGVDFGADANLDAMLRATTGKASDRADMSKALAALTGRDCTKHYSVKRGDSIVAIADKLRVSVGAMYLLNPSLLEAREAAGYGPMLYAGHVLCGGRSNPPKLTVCQAWHTVARGDNLRAIARSRGLSVWAMLRMNVRIKERGPRGSFLIYAGHKLCVKRAPRTAAV